MALHVDPDDRAMAAEPKPGLLKRLFGGRRKKTAVPVMSDGNDHVLDEHPADADLIQSINGEDDLPPPMPPRKRGFKHKIATIFRILGLILWPPFLRGDLRTVNRRLLMAAWTIVLLVLAGAGGWLVTTGEKLAFLPGSEVVIGVGRLALPPEARLAPDLKSSTAAAPPARARSRPLRSRAARPDPENRCRWTAALERLCPALRRAGHASATGHRAA
jgi:hypothetical protein